jgi:hypothetical protein
MQAYNDNHINVKSFDGSSSTMRSTTKRQGNWKQASNRAAAVSLSQVANCFIVKRSSAVQAPTESVFTGPPLRRTLP